MKMKLFRVGEIKVEMPPEGPDPEIFNEYMQPNSLIVRHTSHGREKRDPILGHDLKIEINLPKRPQDRGKSEAEVYLLVVGCRLRGAKKRGDGFWGLRDYQTYTNKSK
jgi:hypothetical protein